MKARRLAVLLLVCFLFGISARGEDAVVPLGPAWPVPLYVKQLLQVASGELGYAEKPDGTSKYGEWANNPSAQWCAEYLCWAVDQTDKLHGTRLLKKIYPLYSASNTGLNWFLKEGRYVARTGFVTGWGSQWFRGEDAGMAVNAYIPQPGDWVFFSYTPSGDTTHVAMVEYAARNAQGLTEVHVLEGNNPDRVQRAVYPLDDWRILGYGTVHDVADIVLRMGNESAKVTRLQSDLAVLGLLGAGDMTGMYSQKTSDAVKSFQMQENLTVTGIANRQTQLQLAENVSKWLREHNEPWVVDNGY